MPGRPGRSRPTRRPLTRPLLRLATFLLLGTLAGGGEAASRGRGLALLLLAAALLALVLARAAARALWPVAFAAAALGAAGADASRVAYERAPILGWFASSGDDSPALLLGSLAADPRPDPDRWTLLVDVVEVEAAGRRQAAGGRVRVVVAGHSLRAPLQAGDGVAAWTRLRKPRGFGTPGAADTAARARGEGVHLVGTCKSPLLVQADPGREGAAWRRVLGRTRAWARRTIRAAVGAGEEEAVVRAMVIGDRTALERDTIEAFRAAGTYHVLAISGAQVALVAALLSWVLRRLAVPRLPAGVATSLLIVAYAAFVGAEVPVTRAAFTAVVVVLGRALDLEADLANLLGLAAAALLVADPPCARDVAFQLSFGATLGIVLLTPVLQPAFTRRAGRFGLALAASCAAQGAIVPFLAVHFHRLALAAPLLNLLAVPLSAAVLLAGASVLACATLLPAALPVAGATAWAAAHLLLLSGRLPGVEFLDTTMPAATPLASILFAAGLVALARGRREALPALAVAFAGLLAGQGAPADGRLHLLVLDVGQGDALVLRSPRGRVWLVDAGPAVERFDAGAQLVAPFLWSEGRRAADGILVTHPHLDHAGGIPYLVRALRLGEVAEGPAARADPLQARLERAFGRQALGRRSLARGAAWSWDGLRIEVLGPSARPRPRSVSNAGSVVWRVSLGNVSFLLTGDVEGAAEDALELGPVDVVKVPHHGSRSSSRPRLLERTRPALAVISTGTSSASRLPDPAVVEGYERVGALVLRTDRDGAVRASTDGRRLWVATFREGAERRLR